MIDLVCISIFMILNLQVSQAREGRSFHLCFSIFGPPGSNQMVCALKNTLNPSESVEGSTDWLTIAHVQPLCWVTILVHMGNDYRQRTAD